MNVTRLNRWLRVHRRLEWAVWPFAWLLVAVHELGHLAALLSLRTGADWRVGIGCRARPDGPRVQLGARLDGSLDYDTRGLDLRQRQRVLLWGPVAVLVFALAMLGAGELWMLTAGTHKPLVGWSMLLLVLACMTHAAINMLLDVDWVDPDGSRWPSDGRQLFAIADALRAEREAAAAAGAPAAHAG